MKDTASTGVLGFDGRLPVIVVTTLLVVSIASAPVSSAAGYAIVVAACSAVVAALLVTVNGFSAVGWLALRIGAGRRGGGAEPPPALDAIADGLPVGVIWQNDQLVCAIELTGPAHAAHWLEQRRVRTSAQLPVGVLEAAITALGSMRPDSVDVVFDAVRLHRGSFAATYDLGLSGRPVAGYRRTVAVLRFTPAVRAWQFGARPSLAVAAATSAARIASAVAQSGCPSIPLDAAALDGFVSRSRPAGRVVRWGHVESASAGGPVDTLYGIEPSALRDITFQELWGIRCDRVLVTLHRGRDGGWEGFARVRTPRPAAGVPLPYLKRLPGQQGCMSWLGRPAATGRKPVTVFDPTQIVDALAIPVGSDGQVIGMSSAGDLLLIPLAPGGGPAIAADVDAVTAEQLVLRAVAVGVDVTVVSADTVRWGALRAEGVKVSGFDGDDEDAPAARPTLTVFDGVSPPGGLRGACLRLGELPVQPQPGQVLLAQHGEHIQVTIGLEQAVVQRLVDPGEAAFLPSARRVTAARPSGV